MRQITIKNLYANLSKEMKSLPFAIVRNKKIIGVVVNPESLDSKIIKSLDSDIRKDKGLDQPKKLKPVKKSTMDWINPLANTTLAPKL